MSRTRPTPQSPLFPPQVRGHRGGDGGGMSIPVPYWRSDCGRYTLYHGDAREVIPSGVLPCVGYVCITDPPYGINHSSGHGASWQNTMIAGDSDTAARDEVIAHFVHVAAFGTWKTPPIENTRGCLVWDKGPAFGMGDLSFPWKPSWELIYVRGPEWKGDRDEGVMRGAVVVSWESKGRVHPHQKPDWIMRALIDKAPFAEVVIDPFMGSGSTGVACVKAERPFIGIEIEERYCAIAKRRIMAEANHLFAGGPS